MSGTQMYTGQMKGFKAAPIPFPAGTVDGYERISGQMSTLSMTKSGVNFQTTTVGQVDGYERSEGGIAP